MEASFKDRRGCRGVDLQDLLLQLSDDHLAVVESSEFHRFNGGFPGTETSAVWKLDSELEWGWH